MTTDSLRLIAPGAYLAGPGVASEVGGVVRGLGTRPLLVHGEIGFAAVESVVRSSLDQADLASSEVEHGGYCTDSSLQKLALAARNHGADVVIGVGGGRVLDAAKGAAARADLPCVTVPTSAATCAAVTALTIVYDEEGRWLRSERLNRCPDAAVIDTEALAGAPARLLAAGVADALAKHFEVTLAAARSSSTGMSTLTALALCRELNELLDRCADGAVDLVRNGNAGEDSRLVAEAVILLPGLIGGLAGEANKLAAAHAIHNAITQVPAGGTYLHGELVGFGILVQLVLEGRSQEEVSETAEWFAGLGMPVGLTQLGVAWSPGSGEEKILAHALAARSLQHAFPDLTRDELRAAIVVADEISRHSVGPGAARRSRV